MGEGESRYFRGLEARPLPMVDVALERVWGRISVEIPKIMGTLQSDPDARLVGQLADDIAFVERWETTPRELVVNAVKRMRTVGKPMGGVLTCVDLERHACCGHDTDGRP